jgi:hypothetical protein
VPLEFVNLVAVSVCWDWWGNPGHGFSEILASNILDTYQRHWSSDSPRVPMGYLPMQWTRLTQQTEDSQELGSHLVIIYITTENCGLSDSEQGAIQSHLHLI